MNYLKPNNNTNSNKKNTVGAQNMDLISPLTTKRRID
jgi:hypothetical protein